MGLLVGIYAPNTPTLVGDLGVRHRPTESALRELGQRWGPKLRAWVVISPHFVTGGGFGVVGQDRLRQIYDFTGFPEEFYQVAYPAPGDPSLARAIVAQAATRGVPAELVDEQWGLDHGAWSPLVHLSPEAAIPVVPVSIAPNLGEEAHIRFGEAIRAAAGDTPIGLVATGSLIHRLDLWSRPGSNLPERAQVFLAAAHRALENGAWQELWEVEGQAMRAAAPEGGRFPLAVMRGALPCFSGKVLAEELEFGAVSLSTVELLPCSQPTPV
jgi:4,5-DOPA dioxygenase extradiol